MRSGMGSFSKVSFLASTKDGNGHDVELDDPHFWENAVGLEAPHESIGEDGNKVIFEKRIRNKINVYDPYTAFAEVCP